MEFQELSLIMVFFHFLTQLFLSQGHRGEKLKLFLGNPKSAKGTCCKSPVCNAGIVRVESSLSAEGLPATDRHDLICGEFLDL